MPTIYDVPAEELIHVVAVELKKFNKITPPEWASYVKTGSFKQHAPQDPDWWFIRCASLLRKVYVSGPIGTSHLRKEYGGLRRGRNRPEKSTKASGAVIRKALQQLESEALISSSRNGRTITAKGRSLLDKLSSTVKAKYPELKKY
ncbi:MAG: 30S ribosomal protein S19e [Candidatus Heimdallarchaeota archaeon]|nr:30S ribosomal protein S19e [Candidatus Heimdallarchaeota archaeon]MBY8994014.1 30S ribosomal protein S19e [Candidatus Heimdallarchaeota archaeon]